jgi:hypothetical protein
LHHIRSFNKSKCVLDAYAEDIRLLHAFDRAGGACGRAHACHATDNPLHTSPIERKKAYTGQQRLRLEIEPETFFPEKCAFLLDFSPTQNQLSIGWNDSDGFVSPFAVYSCSSNSW